MRLFCLLSCFFIFQITTMFAQENVLRPGKSSNDTQTNTVTTSFYRISAGFEAGVNYNMGSQDLVWFPEVPNSIINVFSSASGISPYFSAFLDFPISDDIGIQTKVSYEGRAYSNSYTGIADCNIEGQIFDAAISSDLNVTGADIGISALFRYTFGNGLVFTAGPMALIPAGNYTQEQTLTSLTDECFFDYETDPKKVVTSTVELDNINTRIGIDAGLAYVFPISETMSLAPQVRINYMFSQIIDNQSGFDDSRFSLFGNAAVESTNNYLHVLKFGIGLWF